MKNMHPNTKNFFCQWGPVLSTEQLVFRHSPLSTWYLQPPGTPIRPLLKVPYTYLGAAGFAERGVAPLGAAGFAECGVDSTGLSAAARTNAGVFMETSGGKQCLRNRTLFSEFLQPAVLLQQTGQLSAHLVQSYTACAWAEAPWHPEPAHLLPTAFPPTPPPATQAGGFPHARSCHSPA